MYARTPTTQEVAQVMATIATLGRPYTSGSSARPGRSYLPFSFPEFSHLPSDRIPKNTQERFEAIASIVPLLYSRVVDLGCATGYFSFRAADEGALEVVGVEYDPKAFDICTQLRRIYGYDPEQVTFRCTRVEDALDCIDDIVFAMSVLHWVRIGGGDQRMHQVIQEIARRCSVAFIELPTKGGGGAGIPWLEHQKDVGRYLLEQGFGTVAAIVKVSSHAGPRWTWICTGRKSSAQKV